MFMATVNDGASKMSGYFQLIVIGHHLEAKCDFANALIKRKDAFKQFECYRSLRVEMSGGNEIIPGLKNVVVLTPNLNTPSWTHLKEEIKTKYTNKAFVYVKDDGKVQSNHDEAIAKIKREFPSVPVYVIDYMVIDSTVVAGVFYRGMDFNQKIAIGNAALCHVCQSILDKKKTVDKGQLDVARDINKENPIKGEPHKRKGVLPATNTSNAHDKGHLDMSGQRKKENPSKGKLRNNKTVVPASTTTTPHAEVKGHQDEVGRRKTENPIKGEPYNHKSEIPASNTPHARVKGDQNMSGQRKKENPSKGKLRNHKTVVPASTTTTPHAEVKGHQDEVGRRKTENPIKGEPYNHKSEIPASNTPHARVKGHQDMTGRRNKENRINDKPYTHKSLIPAFKTTAPYGHVKGHQAKSVRRKAKPISCTKERHKELSEKDWDNYHKTLKHGKAKSNLVRVNVVGNHNAGKTTLVKRLQGLNVNCPDENQQPTEALDISEITSRCSDVDGRKQWEICLKGYEDELNVQRMAEAMSHVIKSGHELSQEHSDINEPHDTHSFVVKEDVADVKDSHSFSNMAEDENRDLYLKKINGRLNENATEYMYLSYWDFAGQSTYYSGHQAFLSHSAVYILVVDLSLDLQEQLTNNVKFRSTFTHECSIAESILFWVTSIKAFTTDSKNATAPILIVGTHKFKLSSQNGDLLEEMTNDKFNQIKDILKLSDVECIAIDNSCPDAEDLRAIRDRVLELGLGVIDETISAQWIDLERKIQEQTIEGKYLLSFDELRTLDNGLHMPIRDNDRLEAFLGHQHCRGQLMHFPHKELKNIIFLKPEILAKFLNSLMRAPDETHKQKLSNTAQIYNRNGIINYAYIEEATKHINAPDLSQYVNDLIKMLTILSIIHPYQDEHNEMWYLMPCLLPKRPGSEDSQKSKEVRIFQIEFPNVNMSSTIFYHLIAGLLNQWQPVEPRIGEPEIFNLYACFRLESDTQQMEVKWEKSHILIKINNFSTRKKIAEFDLSGIIEVVKRHIADIFRLYRQTTTKYEVKVQCPKHKGAFVSYQWLKQHGEAMCNSKIEKHAVNEEEVWNKQNRDEEKENVLKREPTDRDLGRLAMRLTHDTASGLASRIRLPQGNIKADAAAQATEDQNCRRFMILKDSQSAQCFATLGDLLEVLTVNDDYNEHSLIECLTTQPTKKKYDLSDEKLENVPDNYCDIIVVSERVGKEYIFLSLELGQSFEMIEQYKYNYHYDGLTAIVRELLSSWRKENPTVSTTRVLLDTAKFVGINTDPIEQEMRNA